MSGRLKIVVLQLTIKDDPEGMYEPILLMAAEAAPGLWVFYDMNRSNNRRIASLDTSPDQLTIEKLLRSLYDERVGLVENILKTAIPCDDGTAVNKTHAVS